MPASQCPSPARLPSRRENCPPAAATWCHNHTASGPPTSGSPRSPSPWATLRQTGTERTPFPERAPEPQRKRRVSPPVRNSATTSSSRLMQSVQVYSCMVFSSLGLIFNHVSLGYALRISMRFKTVQPLLHRNAIMWWPFTFLSLYHPGSRFSTLLWP